MPTESAALRAECAVIEYERNVLLLQNGLLNMHTVSPPEYASIGSAGLGLFTYMGFIGRMISLRPDFFSRLKGVVGCSAGAFIALVLALRYTEKDPFMTGLRDTCKHILGRSANASSGLFPDEGEVCKDLTAVTEYILQHCGFHAMISLRDIQRYIPTQMTFALTDLKGFRPVMVDATHELAHLPIASIIRMSSAVPFIHPPVHERGMIIIDGALLTNTSLDTFPRSETWVLHTITTRSEIPLSVSQSVYPEWVDRLNILQYASDVMTCLQTQNEEFVHEIVKTQCYPSSASLPVDNITMHSLLTSSPGEHADIVCKLYDEGVALALWRFNPEYSRAVVLYTLTLAAFIAHLAKDDDAFQT